MPIPPLFPLPGCSLRPLAEGWCISVSPVPTWAQEEARRLLEARLIEVGEATKPLPLLTTHQRTKLLSVQQRWSLPCRD